MGAGKGAAGIVAALAMCAGYYVRLGAPPQLQAPAVDTFHDHDGLLIIDDFLSAEECETLITMATPSAKASVQHTEGGAAATDSYRFVDPLAPPPDCGRATASLTGLALTRA